MPVDAEAALTLVGALTSLRLSEFAVAGSYRRFDDAAHQAVDDRVLAAVGQLREAAAEAGQRISAVEKMALFYVSANPSLADPRRLRELCARAARRLLPGEERLRYDHLFSPGNPDNKAFWMQWQAHHRALVGRFVRVED